MRQKELRQEINSARADIQKAIELINKDKKQRDSYDTYLKIMIVELSRWLALETGTTSQYWVDIAHTNAKEEIEKIKGGK